MSVVNLPPQSDAKQKGGPSTLNKLSATEISSVQDNVASPTKAATEKIKSVCSNDRVSDDHRPCCSSEKQYKSKDTQNFYLEESTSQSTKISSMAKKMSICPRSKSHKSGQRPKVEFPIKSTTSKPTPGSSLAE